MKAFKDNFFDLTLRSSISERWFVSVFGDGIYNAIKSECLDKYMRQCFGCGWIPVENPDGYLNAHIVNFNQQNPIASDTVLLCPACHCTQHLDIAIENNYIKFVNSSLSQRELVKNCRESITLSKNYELKKIIDIKKDPIEVLNSIRNGTYRENESLKIVFTNNFRLF